MLEAVWQYDGCVPGGVVIGKEVISGRVCHHSSISIVWWSGGDAVVCFRMTSQTKGMAYSVGGGGSEGGDVRGRGEKGISRKL